MAGSEVDVPDGGATDATEPDAMTTNDIRGTRSVLAVAGLFAVNGASVGGIGATMPAMRERLGVDAGGLAALLVAVAAAALISMQVGGRLSDSRGAKNVVLPACALLIAGIASLAFAPNLPLAVAAAALTGLGNGAMDVSMNALGVRVEQARPKPVMSRLHACFSIGNLLAAATVFLIARRVGEGAGVITPALVTLSAASLVIAAGVSRWLPSTPGTKGNRSRSTEAGASETHIKDIRPCNAGAGNAGTAADPGNAGTAADPGNNMATPTGARRRLPRLPAFALLLGAMAFSFGLAEGTAVDWSAVHVTDVAGVSPSTGALGLVAVSSFMVLIRLFGDRAVAAFGRANVVRFGGLVASAGYLVTLLGQPLAVLLIGWALVGLGVGMVAPQVYAVAGHAGGGRMLAIVVAFGYGAFLIGPAIIGALSKQVGVQHAMVLPLVLSAVLVALSRVLSWEDEGRPSPRPSQVAESPRQET